MIRGKITGIYENNGRRYLTIQIDNEQFLPSTELSLTTIGKRIQIDNEV